MKQYQSETIAKLADALAKAQGEMSHAAKQADNPFYKSKYADLPTVIDAARPHLTKHGLSVVQLTDFDAGEAFIVTQLNHSSGEWLRSYYPVKPVKADPQGLGSAITYARRYAYQAMVGIASAADDDDGNAASNLKNQPAFKNSALRNTWVKNTTESLNAAETMDELKTLGTLMKDTMQAMTESGNEYDALAYDEVKKQYTLAKDRISQDAALKASQIGERA